MHRGSIDTGGPYHAIPHDNLSEKENKMTNREAKKLINGFITDVGNKGIGREYREETDKWLFVEHNVLDQLNLKATDALVNYVEDLLESAV